MSAFFYASQTKFETDKVVVLTDEHKSLKRKVHQRNRTTKPTGQEMLNVAMCHCGAIELELAQKPAEVFECNCSICRRLGVLWAYYHCDDVSFRKGRDATQTYIWNQKILEFHSCPTCGCTTHWIAVDRSFRERMGINARLVDGLDRENTKLGFVDHGNLGTFWSK